MIRVYFIFILIATMICQVDAGDISLSASTEVGQRSSGEDYQEEDGDAEYRYQSYYSRFNQCLNPRFNYNLTGSLYNRQYQADSQGKTFTRSFTGNGTYVFSPLLAMNLFVKYRDKNHDQNPTADYRHFAFLPTLKVQINRSFSGGIQLGTNHYRYSKNNDSQNNYLAKVYGRGYLFNSRLVCISSLQMQVLNETSINRKKNKQMLMAGAAYRFDLPLLYKLTARINYGDQDTKDNEAQDYDYDYTATNYYLRGDFNIRTDLKANLAWQKFGKDYLAYQRDHQGYSLSNGWDFYPITDKFHAIWFNLDLGYKSLDYLENPQSGYDKEEVAVKLNYRRKTLWKVSCSCVGNFYHYQDQQHNKNRINCYLTWEQDLWANHGLLTIDLKYRFSQYLHRPNETSLGMRIGFDYNL